ncbi:hypothetical protein [Spirosoma sordidisoli]|uniref:Uncharacterized protein n=1 Tax=Spirosoma sordidisoli TaxID=2502893 RepID=A0A4Q2UUU2_9BACT|nr:hypothetical protein [Spirosoma sordidisoli]RYC70669.1 hypothetical protein EQG79_00525 [Spirosoma sordidisoli]
MNGTDIERRVAELESTVESFFWQFQTEHLDRCTLTRAIRETILDYFKISLQELTGAGQIGTGKGGGYAIRTKSAYDLRMMLVREWTVLLMRQCCQMEWEPLRRVYPWCFQTTFMGAYHKLNALYADPNHQDHELWITLLRDVRERAHRNGIDTRPVDMEISRAS